MNYILKFIFKAYTKKCLFNEFFCVCKSEKKVLSKT